MDECYIINYYKIELKKNSYLINIYKDYEFLYKYNFFYQFFNKKKWNLSMEYVQLNLSMFNSYLIHKSF